MADLYINSNKVQDNFGAGQTYNFEDYMGGSTNIVELKDGTKTIDKHQFTLKTPEARWSLVNSIGPMNEPASQMIIESVFSKFNMIDLTLKNNGNLNTLTFVRCKYAFYDHQSIPETDVDSFMNAFVDDEGTPSDKLIPFEANYSIEIDGKALNSRVATSSGAGIGLLPSDTFSTNQAFSSMYGEAGVSKQINIKGVKAADVAEPQDFTINIKWV